MYARGINSFAMCPICGRRCDYLELKREIAQGRPTGRWVCPDCWDDDNPQWRAGRFPVVDPQTLEHAYPDNDDDGGVTPLPFDHP